MKSELGPADILVNNAAHDQRHDWREMTPDYWDERMAVNLRHMFFAIQAVAPQMIEKKVGFDHQFLFHFVEAEDGQPCPPTPRQKQRCMA